MYVFGDGVSTTTNNTSGLPYYYGNRYSNGRVWVEVLAQRLGLGANSTTNANWSNSPNNWSYYGQYSWNLMTNLDNFPAPPDANTALFVVWVNDADFVDDIATFSTSTNTADWNNAINESLNNHWQIISSLYAKGARTIVMPDAVDITEIPQFDGIIVNDPPVRTFIRQEVINFNTGFTSLVKQAEGTFPGLTIYEPDFFSLLDSVVTNSAAYGLTNVLYDGTSTYAVGYLQNTSLNGPGTNFIFWDPTDPTAKVHEIMADTVKQMIAPAQIGQLTVLGNPAATTTNRLDLVNVPVGLNGILDGSTNGCHAWATVTNFTSTGTNQSVFVTAPPMPPVILPSGTGSLYPGAPSQPSNDQGAQTNNISPGIMQCYRLRFPFTWSWP